MKDNEKLLRNEIETLILTGKSEADTGSSQVPDPVELIEKDKKILQLQSELNSIKSEIGEKQEELQKVDEEYTKLQAQIDQIKGSCKNELQLERDNTSAILRVKDLRLRDLQKQYEKEQQLMASALTNIGYEAYLFGKREDSK
jgi:septal ring factor EnvC (AmiA/AmiB activator)